MLSLKCTLKIHQAGFLNEILRVMNINSDDPLTYPRPLPIGVSLQKHDGVQYEHDLCRSAIGSLIHLSMWTRVDIAYAISALAAHVANHD